MKTNETSVQNIYTLDGKVPPLKAIPFGLQHILAMFVANIAPIIIVAGASGLSSTQTAMLIQSAMIIAGIGTLIQLFPVWKIGSGLPIVMGISFTFVSIACVIGAKYGYPAIVGAVLIGGIVEGVLGLFAKYWIKIVAPIVAASVVTSIGFSLLSVGANSFGGGSGSKNFGAWENWVLGGVTLLACILFNIFAKSYFKQLSVLFGLVVGYILAIVMGMVDFSGLKGSSIIALPHLMPFKPEFHAGAIVSIVLIFLVSATETIGDTSAMASSGLNRDVTPEETAGSIACDGFISALSAVFGCIDRNDESSESICNRNRCGYHDLSGNLPDLWSIIGNITGCGIRWMHDHDVWNDRCQWSADDRKMWLYAEKYYDRCIIAQRWYWFYTGS